MYPEVSTPDYLPEQAAAWAEDNRDLLELLVEELLTTGSWPALQETTRKLAREGKPIALERVLRGASRTSLAMRVSELTRCMPPLESRMNVGSRKRRVRFVGSDSGGNLLNTAKAI